MSPDSLTKLRQLLKTHEGVRQFAYTDTTGNITIGVGRNLSGRGLSIDEINILLDDDIQYFLKNIPTVIPSFNEIDEVRQIVLIDMCFNLGVQGIAKFKNMLSAIEAKDFNQAADDMLDSIAAKQCPARYKNLADILRNGALSC